MSSYSQSQEFDNISLEELELEKENESDLEPIESTRSDTKLAPGGYGGESSRRNFFRGSYHSPSRPISAIAESARQIINGSHEGSREDLPHGNRGVSADRLEPGTRGHRAYLRSEESGYDMKSHSHSRERSLNNADTISFQRSKSLVDSTDLELIRANLDDAIGTNGVGSWLASGESDKDEDSAQTRYFHNRKSTYSRSPSTGRSPSSSHRRNLSYERGRTGRIPNDLVTSYHARNRSNSSDRSVSPSNIQYLRDGSRVSETSRIEEGVLRDDIPLASGSQFLTVPGKVAGSGVDGTDTPLNHNERFSKPGSVSLDVPNLPLADTNMRDDETNTGQRLSALMRRVSARVISAAPESEPEEEDEEGEDESYFYPPNSILIDSNSTLPDTAHSSLAEDIGGFSPPLDALNPAISAVTEDGLVHNVSNARRRVDDLPLNLSGTSLKLFGPGSKIRLRLYYLLKRPWVDPCIFIVIILHTAFLTYQTWGNIFDQHPDGQLFLPWGHSWLDFAFLFIFLVYSVEVVSKIIVQGFLDDSEQFDENAGDSTLFARTFNVFAFKRQPAGDSQRKGMNRIARPYSAKRTQTVIKSFSNLMRSQAVQEEEEPQERTVVMRAFLRGSWNRVDFICVIAYWISFILQVSGVEQKHQFFVFRAISSLRILRLLGLTRGTSAVLQGMKKSAPLLANVVVFIGFFW
ncbi:Cch1p [Sugiyamaella lignohabitans]|uniref:Cch1p n=1 Tax=Sugiyamaella lignohabitans TaxID=796027 RepID=A0A167FKV2_9ASCO|nr:Cch1p [Sugiyamaella lignohabitans]ANB15428.1 Cch1p [Sugiyamaella lignohabitans]